MPVVARGNSWQASVCRKGQRFRRTFTTKAEAEKWETEALAALNRGELPSLGDTLVVPTSMTVKQVFDYTCQHRWRDKSKSQIINGKAVVDALGASTPIMNVTTSHVDACIDKWRGQGNTNATINRKLSALSTLITEAARKNVPITPPHIRWQKESEHRTRYFSLEEENKILSYYTHMGRQDLSDLCAFACDTGLRMGALLKLVPEHFDFHGDGQNSWLRLPGGIMKNGKEHHIPITNRAKEIARRRIAITQGGRLFPFTKDSIEHHWKTMRAHIGYDHDKQFVFHTWRHTYCSRLVQAGIPIVVVQQLAGHETLAITMRYAKLASQNLTSAVGVLEQIGQKMNVPHATSLCHEPVSQPVFAVPR